MFRKRRPRDPAANVDAMMARVREQQPGLDARIADESGATDAATRSQLRVARAVTRLVDGDLAGALEDVDAATALAELPPPLERNAAVILGSAVATFSLASRYQEALDRLSAVPTGELDAATAQRVRFTRAELLMRVGRVDESRALMREAPIRVDPDHPRYAAALVVRAHLHLEDGDVDRALHDVDTALAHGVDDGDVAATANLGAYCIAVLGIEDRLSEAQAWSDLACSPGLGGRQPGIAERETQAAVRTLTGRGAEAIPTLEEGLAFLHQAGRQGVEVGWSHMFLARAHLDVGNIIEARRHAASAEDRHVVSPVLDAVLERLDQTPDGATAG